MDILVEQSNALIVEPLLGPSESVLRHFLVIGCCYTVSGIATYFLFAGLSYFYFFVLYGKHYYPGETPGEHPDYAQLRREIGQSLQALIIIPWMFAPFELLSERGYSRIYKNVDDYGMAWLLLTPLVFLTFSDTLIYWIHRALHWGWLYRHIHKPHHQFYLTTPFSSHAFHPLDGWSQGMPYYIYIFLFPTHNLLFGAMMLVVNFWTISIHDRVELSSFPLVNGASHHTIHHLKSLWNYGQYTTIWDRLCGTHVDPHASTEAAAERIANRTKAQ